MSNSAVLGQLFTMQENAGLQRVWKTLSKMVMVVVSGGVITVECGFLLSCFLFACSFYKHTHYYCEIVIVFVKRTSVSELASS